MPTKVPPAQVPETHVALPAQAAPHAPQLALAVWRLTSQPLLATPSQSPKPALQVYVQLPAAHTVVAFARAGHAVVQLPQLATSFVRLRHAPPHAVSPAGHAITHVPPEQYSSDAHARPHAPQLLRSF
jgi:hypothetical protein